MEMEVGHLCFQKAPRSFLCTMDPKTTANRMTSDIRHASLMVVPVFFMNAYAAAQPATAAIAKMTFGLIIIGLSWLIG